MADHQNSTSKGVTLQPAQLLQLVLDTIPQHVFWKDRDSVYIGCNKVFAEAAGIEKPDEIVGLTDFDLPWTDDEARFYRACDKLVMDQNQAEIGIVESQTNNDGELLWLETNKVPLLDLDGNVIGILGSFHDITKIKEAEQTLQRSNEQLEQCVEDRTKELRYLAEHDSLTGLASRDRFMCALTETVQSGAPFALLFIDLNRFKSVNDSLGHAAGDELLTQVAACLHRALNAEDIVGRFGGDEFTVILRGIRSSSDVTNTNERIHQELASSIVIGDAPTVVTASIGFVIDTEKNYASASDVLRDADIAMYVAKGKGKGNASHCLFKDEMLDIATEKLTLESQMRRGLLNNEFFVVYQPIFDLSSGRLLSFETLVRWRRPGHGVVLPDKFLPLAEETGLIVPIGEQVLRQACQQLSDWKSQFGDSIEPFAISVNLSAAQVHGEDFSRLLKSTINEFRLDPQFVSIEITESLLLSDHGNVSQTFQQLRQQGHQLLLDDFGTGYSSLSYLHQFPVDALKIDRSFVQHIESDRNSQAIVRTILALAEVLQLGVIAEGVETPEQEECLRLLNCSQVQGYLYAKPMEPKKAEAYLRENSKPHKQILRGR